jgi:probable phosphoglycerate mutase
MSGPSRLLLIRHAQSTWNAAGRWQGWADPPLSAEAAGQIAEAAASLRGETFGLVATSDLVRARDTAEQLITTLALTAECLVEPGLREYDAGEWSGLSRDEIEQRWPGDIERYGRQQLDSPPRGEPRAAFERRVTDAGRRVAEAARKVGGRGLLVVTHGGVVRALARASGVAEHRVGHLAGYRGRHEQGGLFPETPVDLLLGPNGAGDVDETAATAI